MKILLAHNHFKAVGGAEVFYHEVGRVLELNGHEVAYFSPNDSDIDSPWKDYFPKVVDYKNTNKLKSILGIKDMIYSSPAKQKMVEILTDFKPDIVHVFAIYVRLTPSILDACNEMNVPVVMSCNDYKHICPSYKLYHHGQICEDCKGGKFYHAIINKCSKDSVMYSVASALEAYAHSALDIYRKNVNMFLFASTFMAKKTEEFWGKDTFQWDILQNPFNSKKYQVYDKNENYCLFFGRLIDEKGVDILIKAMQYAPECSLKIIGNGPDESKLKSLKNKLNLQNIEFCGSKWGDELDSILKKARFVIVPSIWYENFPYVILQSFAYAKAVIGSNKGGIPELINGDKHGLIYNALDEKELANKILQLWNNPKQTTIMGQNAKKYVDTNFNDEEFYTKIIQIYKKVLS